MVNTVTQPRFGRLVSRFDMSHWLMLWFSAIVLMACLPLGLWMYYHRAQEIRQQALGRLGAILEMTSQEIGSQVMTRRAVVERAAGRQEVSWICGLDKVDDGQAGMATGALLAELRLQAGASGVALLKPGQGFPFLASFAEGAEAVMLPRLVVERVRSLKKTVFGTLPAQAEQPLPAFVLAAPVFGVDGPDMVGVIAYYYLLDAHVDLKFMFRQYLGNTGEVLIANEEAEAHRLLRQKGFKGDRRNVLNSAIARRAGSREIYRGEMVDVMGSPVLAVCGPVSGTSWGLAVKQDLAEISSPVRVMATHLFLGSCFGLLVAILVARLVAIRIARPVEKVALMTEEVAAGNLEVEAPEFGSLEIQRIARGLNRMVARLGARERVSRCLNTLYASFGKHKGVADLVSDVLPQLMDMTRSQLGVLYLGDRGDFLQCRQAYGIAPERLAAEIRLTPPDSLLSRVAASRTVQVIDDIPEDSGLTMATPAGDVPPRALLGIPLLWTGKSIGVIGLGSIYSYRDEDLEVARNISRTLGQAAEVCLAHEESNALSETLQASNEELAVTNEELAATNEELQVQAEELHQQSARLEAQRIQIEHADQLKSEFLSNMSHELRTPLNSVMALSQLILSRGAGKNPEKDTEYLQIIERNGRNLLNLINDILDLSKIEAGRMDVFVDVLNPARTAAEVVDTLRPMAELKSLSLQIQCGDLPVMHSDEGKIRQILLNLVSNAVKFTKEGRVLLRASQEQESIRFVVEDSGIGISRADQSHIFEEFRQVDGSATRQYAGTGLGLAISKKMARLLGGDITVESCLGTGSVFTLSLPLEWDADKHGRPEGGSAGAPPAVQAPAVEKCVPAQEAESVDGGQTILVVDDDPKIQRMLKQHLSAAGYTVFLAKDGREGLALARKIRPKLITLDILMPEMDGWEVLRSLKADPGTAGIPVVMTSVSDDRLTGMAMGAAAYVLKPIEKNVLFTELTRLSCKRPLRRVLIVEDDPGFREHLQNILSERYDSVETASSGQEAWQLALSNPPDALILDLFLPDMNGGSLLTRLRNNPATQDVPVIILTAQELSLQEQGHLAPAVERIITKGMMETNAFLNQIDMAMKQVEFSQTASAAVFRKPHVLVVEDTEVAALQIRTVLEEKGYGVIVASNGFQAMESIRTAVPKAVILDLMMPEMDGFQLLEKIRGAARTSDVPVLVLTAKDLNVEDRIRLKDGRVQQLVQKGSLDRDQLVACVDRLLADSAAANAPDVRLGPAAVQPPTPKAAPVNPAVRLPGSEQAQGVRGPILVVEDHPDNLLTISAILEENGYDFVVAKDGQAGVVAAKEHTPSLILMDIQLPVMDGLEATRLIKTDPKLVHIPVVALTAKAMNGDREAILTAGCDDYMAKPLDPQAFIAILQKWDAVVQ